MREIRPSGLEGGVALTRHPYPYRPMVVLNLGAVLGCAASPFDLYALVQPNRRAVEPHSPGFGVAFG